MANKNNTSVLFSFQCNEFLSDDWDDQQLCKLAAECEDYRNSNYCNSKTQEALHTTECDSKGLYTLTDHARCDIEDWDNDWDDDSLLEAHNEHVRYSSDGLSKPAKNLQKQHKGTQEEFQGNDIDTRKSLRSDNASEVATLNDGEPIDDDEEEEVCDWLVDDPISDLELSFAAEEVENTAYQ